MDTFRSQKEGTPNKSPPDSRGILLPIVGLVVGTLIPVLVIVLFFNLRASSSPPVSRKIGQARADVRGLAQQAQIFLLNNPAPESIVALTLPQPNGGPPLVPRDKIIDPWGKEYQLDTTGVRVIVWTIAPDGTRIGSDDK